MLLWMVANAVGIVLAGFVGVYVGFAVSSRIVASTVEGINIMQETGPISFAAAYVSGMVTFATVVGLIQWLVLRARAAVTAQWVLATVLGAALGTVVGIAATIGVRVDAKAFIVMSVGAATIAPSQWLVLRRHLSKSLWWIPTSAVGVVGSWAVNWLIGLSLYILVTGAGLFRFYSYVTDTES